MRVRRLIADDFQRAFEKMRHHRRADNAECRFYVGRNVIRRSSANVFARHLYGAVNLAGLPALSAPCGFVDNLPVGLQLIGSPLTEARLLAAANDYQKHTDWHLRKVLKTP